MSTIETIYNSFRGIKQHSIDHTINFFETSPISLSEFKSFKERKDLKFFIELTWQYTNALFQKHHYNETIDKIILYFPIIENEIERLGDNTLKDNWYYGILFFQGMASHNLHDFKTATPIFKQLLLQDPKNDNYKDWYNSSLYGKRMRISKSIMIVCLTLFAIAILFHKYFPFNVKMSLEGIALLGLMATTIYDYYTKRSRRKNGIE